jgi:flagellar hook-associated protein 2
MIITGTYENYQNMSSLLSSISPQAGSTDSMQQALAAAVNAVENNSEAQTFQTNLTDVLNQLQANSSDLADTAGSLTSDNPFSVFNDRTAVSSDSSVLTATAYSALSPDTGASVASYSMNVYSMATAQNNIGSELTAADPSAVGSGTNTIDINVNGVDNQISFAVESGDTNDTVLQKMAGAINSAGIGVTATVISGKTAGTEQLAVAANNTGASSTFTVSDATGNAVQATGAGTVVQTSQDASYTVDGTSYTSGSNTISLDQGMVTVTLQGTGTATLNVAPDANKVEQAVTDFVSGINNFIDFLDNNSSYIKPEVLSTINNFISENQYQLGSLGITQGTDGKLTIDTGTLSAAVTQNMSGVQDALTGIEGLAKEVSDYASGISQGSPANYAQTMDSSGTISPASYSASGSILMDQMLIGSLFNTYT